MDFTPAVLRNRGVPILLYVVEDKGGAWGRVLDDAGDPKTEEVRLRFTANHVAELEDRFNGVEYPEDFAVLGPDGEPTGEMGQRVRRYAGLAGFVRAAQLQPVRTCRTAFSICLNRPEESIGEAMLPEEHDYYEAALSGAWAIANGVAVESVGKALLIAKQSFEARSEALRAATEAELADLETTDTPGGDGSPLGSETPSPADSGEASTSSGS